MSQLEVRGWQGASKEDCIAFLNRKVRNNIVSFADVQADVLIVNVRSPSDADTVAKWSGVRFAGQPLRITKRASQSNSDTINMLTQMLQRRYNPQAKMLDLSNVMADPLIPARSTVGPTKMYMALMKIASQEKLDVESVNLSDNNFEDVSAISTLAQAFPNLRNLALSNNRISRLQSLDTWKGKFKFLRELVMANNPITVQPQYKNHVCKVFPRLIILDGVVVRDEAKLSMIYNLPMPHKQFFFEDAEIEQLCQQFVTNFIQFWDNDRTQLLPLYTAESQFSMSVDSSVPNDAQASDVSFGYYIPVSRNISRVSSQKSRDQRLGKGPEQIAKLFEKLPRTKHKLDTDISAYSMEAWRYPQVNGFIVSLHGEFNEVGHPLSEQQQQQNQSRGGYRGRRTLAGSASAKLTPKSFDRVFVIVPAQGSIVIASDMLTVRAIASHSAWDESTTAPTPAAVPTPALPPSQPQGTPTPPPPSTTGDQLTPEQTQFVTKLMMETKLNPQFTLLLAQQAGWNYDAAIQGFAQSQQQGQIPPEAFQ